MDCTLVKPTLSLSETLLSEHREPTEPSTGKPPLRGESRAVEALHVNAIHDSSNAPENVLSYCTHTFYIVRDSGKAYRRKHFQFCALHVLRLRYVIAIQVFPQAAWKYR